MCQCGIQGCRFTRMHPQYPPAIGTAQVRDHKWSGSHEHAQPCAQAWCHHRVRRPEGRTPSISTVAVRDCIIRLAHYVDIEEATWRMYPSQRWFWRTRTEYSDRRTIAIIGSSSLEEPQSERIHKQDLRTTDSLTVLVFLPVTRQQGRTASRGCTCIACSGKHGTVACSTGYVIGQSIVICGLVISVQCLRCAAVGIKKIKINNGEGLRMKELFLASAYCPLPHTLLCFSSSSSFSPTLTVHTCIPRHLLGLIFLAVFILSFVIISTVATR